jgi:hypothetical protein
MAWEGADGGGIRWMRRTPRFLGRVGITLIVALLPTVALLVRRDLGDRSVVAVPRVAHPILPVLTTMTPDPPSLTVAAACPDFDARFWRRTRPGGPSSKYVTLVSAARRADQLIVGGSINPPAGFFTPAVFAITSQDEQPGSIETRDFTRGSVDDIIALPDRYVAVGQLGRIRESPRPAVWISTDGLRWNLTLPLGESGGYLLHIGTGKSGRLIVAGDRDLPGGGGAPVVLRSDDSGMTWTDSASAGDQRVFFVDAKVSGISRSDSGFVMVGSVVANALRPKPPRALMWFSLDGSIWRLTDIADVAVGLESLSTVTSGVNGLLAIGRATNKRNVVLQSASGEAWRRLGEPLGLAGENDTLQIDALTSTGSAYFALGYDWTLNSIFSASTLDGITWRRIDKVSDPDLATGYTHAHGLLAAPDELIAVGGTGPLRDPLLASRCERAVEGPAVWTASAVGMR